MIIFSQNKNYNTVIQSIGYLFILLCFGCSPRLLTTYTNSQILSTTLPVNSDKILPESDLTLEDPLNSVSWTGFNPKAIHITDNFTDFDTRYVQAKDPLLFKESNELIIDFGKLAFQDFVFPLSNARIISHYGTRRGRMHTGVDLKTFANDTIRATFSGIVRIAIRHGSYGNLIVIRHYNGLETVYSHNSKNLIASGTRVKAGEAIALTGRTGRATTEHLHFEIRINGQHFDPNRVINFNEYKLIPQSVSFTQRDNGRIRIESLDKPIVSR